MLRRVYPILFVTVFILFARTTAHAAQVIVHVATNGNDRATGRLAQAPLGSSEGPLQSVQVAIDVSEKLRREIPDAEMVVEIAGGRYELPNPLVLTPADSYLVITASAGADVELSGGSILTGWVQSPTNQFLWRTTLPKVRIGGWYFNQLFVDGRRAIRAKTPNTDYFLAEGVLGLGPPVGLPFHRGDLSPLWTSHPGGSVVLLMKWSEFRMPLLGVNEATRIASLGGGPLDSWMDEPNARYWIENIPEALDAPGEWYLDGSTGILSYYGGPGWSPKTSRVTAPRLQELVRVTGNLKNHDQVHAVRFQGLRFTECDYEITGRGFVSPQAAVLSHGAIVVESSDHGVMSHCSFENLGGYGVELASGAQRWEISGNRMRSLGAGGIRIGDPHNAEPTAWDACFGHRIEDNDLGELGRVFSPAAGIAVFHSGQNQLRHNHIHDLYYTGISVGWTWGYYDSPCRDNLIEFNLVEQVGQGRLTDLGGIYTLGRQPGTVIRNNLFRDIQSHDYGGWGLYTDEGSSGILLENNIVYRCKSAGFHQHYGRDNLVRNNLFAFNHDFQLMRTRAESHRSFEFTHNVVVFDSGELLGSNWSGTTNNYLMTGNIYWDTRLAGATNAIRFGGRTFSEWQLAGQDAGSVIADPLLVDPEHPEKGLDPKSPAYGIGFRAIDAAQMGVRASLSRK